MAIATAYTAVNMNTNQFWEAIAQNGTATQIVQEGAAGERQVWNGSFQYDVYEDLSGGVATSTTHTIYDQPQYSVTGLSHNASTIYDYLQYGTPQQLFAYIFGGNDTFNGSGFADVINGYNGNDKLNGNGGADQLNGGAGIDKLKLSVDLDLTGLLNNKFVNLEQINMVGGGGDALTLNKSDVLSISSTTDILKIFGDMVDTVVLASTFNDLGEVAGGFHKYKSNLAILLVDTDINVTMM